MIVSDIDGTLVDEKQNISTITHEAVERYLAAGGLFTVATGRMESAVHRFQEQLGLNAPAVLYNGARVVSLKNDEVIHEWKLTPCQVETAARMLERYPMDGILYQDGKAYIKKMTDTLAEHAEKDRVVLNETGSFDSLDSDRITKILMIGDNRCFQDFQNEFNASVELKPEFVQSESDYLEILPAGVDKGEAVKALSDYCGISMSEVICIGDNLNDLGMIKTAGLGIAVANANEQIKAAAGMTALSNIENGVADIIDRVLNNSL